MDANDALGAMDAKKENAQPRRMKRIEELNGVSWTQGSADRMGDGQLASQANLAEMERLNQILRDQGRG